MTGARVAAGAAMLAALASANAAEADATITPYASVGNLTLGMTVAQVRAAAGLELEDGCPCAKTQEGVHLSFSGRSATSRLEKIHVRSDRYTLAGGVRVGSTLAQARRRLPSALRCEGPNRAVSAEPVQLEFPLRLASRALRPGFCGAARPRAVRQGQLRRCDRWEIQFTAQFPEDGRQLVASISVSTTWLRDDLAFSQLCRPTCNPAQADANEPEAYRQCLSVTAPRPPTERESRGKDWTPADAGNA